MEETSEVRRLTDVCCGGFDVSTVVRFLTEGATGGYARTVG
jgi:hypothetical protein